MLSLMGLILFLIIIGVVLYMFPAIDGTVKSIILGLVIIISLVWLFVALGWVSAPAFR